MDHLERSPHVNILAPPISFLLYLRMCLESGDTIFIVLQKWRRANNDVWTQDLVKFMIHYEQGTLDVFMSSLPLSVYRQAIFETLRSGLKGEPILSRLIELEEEIMRVCERDIDKHVASLPVISLLPLLLLQLPAFLLLLFGPLLSVLTQEVLK